MKVRVHTARAGRRLFTALSALAALVVCFALNGATASAAGCPNEAIREAQVSDTLPQGTTFLPNCMALELVSPPKKYNQYAEAPNFSANGDRVKFFSLAALGETPRLGSLFDPYIATRTKSGWVTEATTGSPEIDGGSGASGYACTYSTDLLRWAFFGSSSTQEPIGLVTAFRGELGGVFGPISPTMVPLSGNFASFTIRNSYCEGASADISHFYFTIKNGASYLPGDPVPTENGEASPNVYETYFDEGIPTVALLQRDKDGVVYGGSCGVAIGRRAVPSLQRGAISPDASRIYFTASPDQPEGQPCSFGSKKRIMLRQQTPAGPVISELASNECTRVAPPCSSVDGDDQYLGASQEGGRVFFASGRQLANSDTDTARDLYLHDALLPAGQRLTQVSSGDNTAPTPGEGADFLGLAEFSGDGTRAYFAAEGVLTTAANEAGDVAQAGEPNLYLYQRDATYPSGRTVFIATLGAAESPIWSGPPGESARAMAVPRLGPDPEDISAGGDGRALVFQSTTSLTADDTDGGLADLYRYESETGVLERVTAADPGGEDNGPLAATAPVQTSVDIGPISASFNRWVSEDGEAIVFLTKEKLDPLDTDTAATSYIWSGGELTPLPPLAEQPTISMSGEQVAFTIGEPLLPEDGDGANDVYVARGGGGYPIVVPPPPCAGEACQGAPGPRPVAAPISSQSTRTGNVKQAPCKKGQARKRGRCVKKQRGQRKAQSKSNRKQGGRK